MGCDELADLFLKHHVWFEGSEICIPSCGNTVGKGMTLHCIILAGKLLELHLEWLWFMEFPNQTNNLF